MSRTEKYVRLMWGSKVSVLGSFYEDTRRKQNNVATIFVLSKTFMLRHYRWANDKKATNLQKVVLTLAEGGPYFM